ncbi:MAG: ABC transporter ATP-binding protein [Ferrimicrobium sp.]
MAKRVVVTSGEALVLDHVSVVIGGGQRILDDISFSVDQGELLGLIGPNGAGKSTAVNVISGFLGVASGSVTLNGQILGRMPPYDRSRLGLARTFQNLELFSSMTVFENVLCGLEGCDPHSVLSFVSSRRRRQMREKVRVTLASLNIDVHRNTEVEALPYGTKKLVELARVIVRQPRLVLLDEPVAGLNHGEKARFADLFAEISSRHGFSGVLIEHDMSIIETLCARVVVLDAGKKLAEGPVGETLRRSEVVTAYMGHGQSDGPRSLVDDDGQVT